MKKGPIVILILVISIFLISCQNNVPAGEQPLETEAALRMVQTGMEGVELSFLPNYPPNLIYDQNELVAILEVKNKGNYDLEPQNCFVQVTGHDTNIIGGDFDRVQSCATNIGVLEGKSVYNVEGGSNQIEFRAPYVRLPEGVYEYSPTLNFLTCYNYLTKANPEVCVDPSFYQVTSEQKACTPQNVIMGGGQGAPVGISYVGVDMVGGRAVFEINVKNFGSGRVLSPYADIQSCGQASLEYTDLDKVSYGVRLSSGGPLNCKPLDGTVRLVNGQGKIICNYDIPGSSAFATILQVELDYGYIESMSKPVKIIATPR
ncbi:MAG: hypothetical protein KJ597_03565 [Nanoarchaeota archaeon]|nr:hypothetical protein [Nanoarchaeota archaeon]MBU1622624.1 hypothetical protein [Nanoarchaeota archaeon]